MDQQFESDVMHDLMADSPTASADEAFQEDLYDDGFEAEGFEEDAIMDGMDQYDEAAEDYGDEASNFEEDSYEESFDDGFEDGFIEDFDDEFAEDDMDVMDAMEAAVADALDADDTDAFLRRLISGVRGVTGTLRRGVSVARQVAGGIQRVAGQVDRVSQDVQGLAGGGQRRPGRSAARGADQGGAGINMLQQVLPMLQQHIAQSSNEMDVFEDLVDWFEQEQIDEALPIVAGLAARAALRPIIRQAGATGRSINRQVVRATTQAAQNLTRRQGTRAVRALRPIAASIGRVAVRRGMKPGALPDAIRRTAVRIVAQPALTRRLISTTVRINRRLAPRTDLNINVGSVPRRFVVNGSVEIIIRR